MCHELNRTSLYNAMGYPVVRIGEYWSTTQKRTEQLKPKLQAAIANANNADFTI